MAPSEEVVISDGISTDDEDPNASKPWHSVCVAAPVSGQVGDNLVTLKDYSSLTPRLYITDSLINFGLRLSVYKYNTPLVLVLSTDFSVRLMTWSQSDPDKHGLLNWATQAGLWTGSGARYVLLPVVWSSHYYLFVGVLDFASPTVYILESIGTDHFARAPPVIQQFINFLEFLQVREQVSKQKFMVEIPPVPRQSDYSNNCGVFLLHFAELIIENPTDFELKVSSGNLESWFDADILLTRRQELVELIKDMAIHQHGPGGELEKSVCVMPLPSPDVVRKMVSIISLLEKNRQTSSA